ncbi:hypothetical protein NFI96_017443 [Prochilodus magdalenae]|nr:hypothetical protein NFI96_017443 [Prochilodus magdalenae]
MKKSSLNFLKQKSPSLFDTNVQIKHYDNVELSLNPAVIPESGTAKVRSRPTVKHFSTSGDGALGFAVPTPTVPVFPPNGPQSHTGSTETLSNGAMISVADPEEGEILIPAPPSMAPPPPPPQFIPPSPKYIPPPLEFFGDMDPTVDLAALQPPSMPPPKPPSVTGSTTSEELDLVSLKPPPMAPPKPPTELPSSANAVQDIPECPKFTPPLPPVGKPQSPIPKTPKTPPPKPVRLSSMYNLTELTPAPTPATTPASSFNPQTTAKLYSAPKTTVLTSQVDRDAKTQHILLLEDTSGNPVGVHINGKVPVSPAQNVVPPVKPFRRSSSGIQLDEDVQGVQEAPPSGPPKSDRAINEDLAKVVTSQEVQSMVPDPVNGSPKTERALAMPSVQEMSQVKELPASQSKARSYSPLLNRKLHNLRGHEGSSVKEPAASPLALLMAAKEREKQRSVLSRQSSNKSSSSAESMSVSIHPNEARPNSFIITPTHNSSNSLNPEPKLPIPTQSQPASQSPKTSRQEPSTVLNPAPSRSNVTHPTEPKSAPPPSQEEDSQGAIAFIPPPPEFANSDPEDDTPPSIPHPDPPIKSVAQSVKSIPTTNGPAAPPKPKSPNTPALPTNYEPKLKYIQIKPQAPPGQPPVQVAAPPLTQPKTQIQTQTLPPSPPKTQPPAPPITQPKTQIPAPPPTQPPAPPTQPKTQIPAPPPTQPPAPPSTQPRTQIPAPPPTQPPAPPSTQPKTQIPAPPPTNPKTQIPAPPQTQAPGPPTAQLKNKIPAPPPTQAPAPPPTQPKAQLPTPSIAQLKTQLPAPPLVQPKTQPPAPPLTLPKTQPPAPPPIQLKTQPPAPPPIQPKSQTLPSTQSKTQIPAHPPPSVSASQATLLSILQKKMLEMDPKFAPARETDTSGDDWNSPLSDDDGATSPPPFTSAKPKSATLPMQTQGLDMKELEAKASKKAQDLATKTPRNGPNSKQQFGMTFTIRPGTKQPITPVLKTD